jgi:hypothetical protein
MLEPDTTSRLQLKKLQLLMMSEQSRLQRRADNPLKVQRLNECKEHMRSLQTSRRMLPVVQNPLPAPCDISQIAFRRMVPAQVGRERGSPRKSSLGGSGRGCSGICSLSAGFLLVRCCLLRAPYPLPLLLPAPILTC